MFRERIDRTPYVSEEANYYFKNINGGVSMYAGDMSMLSTIRALLAERIPEGGSVGLLYRNYELSKADAERFDDEKIVTSAVGCIAGNTDMLTILEVVNTDTQNKVISAIKNKFCECFDGWEYDPKVEARYLKSFPALCFLNAGKRSAILVVDRLTLRKWHVIQPALKRCFPWYFTPENPITEEEKALLLSLTQDNPTEYLKILGNMVQKYDFERSRIKRLLDGFETTYERRRVDAIRGDIDNKRRQIENYNNSISQILAELRDLNFSLVGAQEAIESRDGESLLMEYFLADRKLGIERAEDGNLYFTVKGYLENFDEDEAEARIGNANSFVYRQRPSNCRIDSGDMAKLMRAVFVDRTIKLRVCAAYRFTIGDRAISVRPQDNKSYPAEFDTYMPNPHIQNYGCMGAYTRIINELLMAGDYVGSVVQCEVSCASLNWTDQCVMESFIRNAYSSTGFFYELQDGSCVDQVGAVKWIKEQEGKKHE